MKIGIFDSGIGGLTVAQEISRAIPSAQILYFGDTAHLPYGEKSKNAIIYYSKKIGDFLVSNDCQHIVIACNTASSFAFEPLKKHLYGRAFVYNVIDPVAGFVAQQFPSKNVGVIGTKGTISSRIYPRKITSLEKSIKVFSLATPLLAPMIEEGFFNNKISKTIIDNYLSKKELKDIQALILACTHYPLIKETVQQYYKNAKCSVDIIDSALIVAQSIQAKLGPLPKGTSKPKHHFFVSDYTQSFEESAINFFGTKIKLSKKDLWMNDAADEHER